MRNSFKTFLRLREGAETFDQPHTVSVDPPMKLPDEIVRLAEAFKKAKEVSIGKEVDPKGGEKDITLRPKRLFVVGDAVAAHLMKRTPRSFDLVTDAHPDEVVKICEKAVPPVQVIKKDDKKGVVTVAIGGKKYDIETLKDGETPGEDGSHPYTTDLGKDTHRRDLTMDALYYDILGKKVIDYAGGLRHLQGGEVKFVGNAKDRIAGDGMKKFKYLHMVNRIPNGKVGKDMQELITAGEGEELPPEKVREQFWAGFEDLHVKPKQYVKAFADSGLLNVVFPGLELTTDLPDIPSIKSRAVAIAALLKTNPPQKLVEVLRKLKYTDREVKDAVYLINLLRFNPQYAIEFRRQLLRVSLSQRQISDWVKANNLNKEAIDAMMKLPLPELNGFGVKGF